VLDIDRPGDALVIIGRALGFDDDAEHGLAVVEQDYEVSSILRGLYVGEVRRFDAGLGIRGQLDMQRIA
jgi:hypothetical protein